MKIWLVDFSEANFNVDNGPKYKEWIGKMLHQNSNQPPFFGVEPPLQLRFLINSQTKTWCNLTRQELVKRSC